ncbi:hypothetical protein [Pseudomonas aeruginosa]|uniref:hypothetical protein n=1 Tax=Pseudomonas aeruginosa TaxID=287 RepID=UPI003F51C7B9
MSSTQHQLIEQCATRLRGIVEALDNIHDTSPHRWSTDLDDVHSSAESLLAMIKGQAPTQAAQGLAGAALAQPSPVHSSLLINGYQLRAALDFIAPDGTAEQLESEACIEWRQQDADFLEAGLYAFCAEYPEEGGVLLDEEPTNSQPSPAQELAERGTQHRFSTTEQTCRHDFAGVWWNDNGETKTGKECRECGFFIADIPEAPELERPEVVGYRIMRAQADKIYQRVDKAAAEYEAGRSALGYMEDIAEAALCLRNRLDDLLAAAPAQAQHSVPDHAELLQALERTHAGHMVGHDQSDQPKGGYSDGYVNGFGECIKVARKVLAAAPGKEVPQAWLDVQAERRRQITVEGFDTSNDDASAGQIAQAAGCYALHAGGIGTDWPGGIRNGSALFWPWDEEWWKPKSARENLVRAGALVLAEIERLDRAGISQSPQPGATTASS